MSLQTVVCHQRCIAGPVTQTHEQCHSFVCHSLCRPLLHSTLSRITAEFCSVLLSVSVSLFTCLFDVVFLVVCYQESLLSLVIHLSIWRCVSCCLLSRITAEFCSVLLSVSVSLFTCLLDAVFLVVCYQESLLSSAVSFSLSLSRYSHVCLTLCFLLFVIRNHCWVLQCASFCFCLSRYSLVCLTLCFLLFVIRNHCWVLQCPSLCLCLIIYLSVWRCVSCCLLSRITAEVCSVLFSVSVSLFTVCLTLCFLLFVIKNHCWVLQCPSLCLCFVIHCLFDIVFLVVCYQESLLRSAVSFSLSRYSLSVWRCVSCCLLSRITAEFCSVSVLHCTVLCENWCECMLSVLSVESMCSYRCQTSSVAVNWITLMTCWTVGVLYCELK